MLNPPFFDQEGKQSLSNTSHPLESIVEGGEESFVVRLIEESFIYKTKIKLYSVMLGRKISFKNLKHKLQSFKDDGVLNFIDTEFCQGKTIRWGICWTFDLALNLNLVHKIKHAKKSPIFVYKIPETKFLYTYNLIRITECILKLLDNIQISKHHLSSLSKSKFKIEFTIRTNLNTWSHQRRKRRLAKQTNRLNEEMLDSEMVVEEEQFNNKKRLLDELESSLEEEDCAILESTNEQLKRTKTASEVTVSDEIYLLNCIIKIQQEKEYFYLKITANDRIKDKDSVHQLFQYLKNNL